MNLQSNDPTCMQHSIPVSAESLPHVDPLGGCSEAMLREQLKKMLRSAVFARSRRLRKFLRFSVEQTILGRTANLKEYSIGLEVFEKPETFDPRMDSIVRVVARRLRSLVEAYYNTEGQEDPVIINFQCGSYVPHILLRSDAERNRNQVHHGAILLVAHHAAGEIVQNSSITELMDAIAQKIGGSVSYLPAQVGAEALRRVLSNQARVAVLTPQKDGSSSLKEVAPTPDLA